MDFGFGDDDETFRTEVREWLSGHVDGSQDRRAWERTLGKSGWVGLGWGEAGYGNRTATLTQQVVWAEEYARSGAPARSGHIGEKLLAPTLLAHGSDEQKARFLPPVAAGEELWCQGYSEPGAGSDLAGVRTRAARGGDGTYRITGQKIWTSLAHEADWCFVLARTDPQSRRHHGLTFLLVPMDQPGRIEVRPIRQLTGTSEFNEVFFDGAHARADHVVGGEGNGWRVAMSLLGFERGVSTLAQQIGFAQELTQVVQTAVRTGAVADPVVRALLVRQWAELRTMRWNALRTLGDSGDAGASSVAKLLWAGWHQRLGELAMLVRGARATVGPGDWTASAPYGLDALQQLFLFSRADTIYGGSDQIQRTIIAERVLGLPREPKGVV
ncbi:alkylation response protein AidB-like acyl-CoA dehydrogenase [Streptomyces sp. SAI-135]|uniref:acyl-CoA dehydrogenase family protein n=1 Tax=unclassified Streptomyces TaxID=2593676 RepID=UPI0024745407|nr:MULTISPECIES: acyl-CoA dehydrogenase family protein [unclassified Streptomyces]MDH6518366.1 alkylation response protein AidB-like acyl-CoA dehydrogenase [Streptomyces sp. SAI-090]MDH6550583.1 alkylation response protein AidB-like acyl-CoA dehydrogenase [Streptomyces sp. SAI-041]MDH6569645.1 alkylation response protein AidB-like acyl-CoA dehydrogenase [Streptomyces sp. SAI-117]MDH6585397.1 alkylation response protein AidB-like acyl-CoA dehydrogenase [Streptomyces sp. SAI-133]MDH6617545.1 alk